MQTDDRIPLQHMLDATHEALMFSSGHSRDDLAPNRVLSLALVKDLEIIGEAAAHVTEATRTSLPVVPWRDVIAMRNRLIHGYFDIDIDLVWATLLVDLPALAGALEAALSRYPDLRRHLLAAFPDLR